jgi:hypothetical protein
MVDTSYTTMLFLQTISAVIIRSIDSTVRSSEQGQRLLWRQALDMLLDWIGLSLTTRYTDETQETGDHRGAGRRALTASPNSINTNGNAIVYYCRFSTPLTG